jgi:hypothetical protein
MLLEKVLVQEKESVMDVGFVWVLVEALVWELEKGKEKE